VMQKKYEGRIITIMPVAIILFLQIMSPDYLQVMYSTAAGRILMSLALAAIVIAYFMIERITSIEV
ncbi:MAG: type II secretion system F family protein, partial [Emergencia timonensis]